MKINISHAKQALIESWVFAGLGVDLGYFITKGIDALDHKEAVINWTIVGFLFLAGAGAPILRVIVARFPWLSPFANKLITVIGNRAGIPVAPITVTTITSPAPVEVTSVTSTAPVEVTPPTA